MPSLSTLDYWAPAVYFAIWFSPIIIYAFLTFSGLRKTYARVEKDGGSKLLSKFLMEAYHYAITPIADFAARRGITPNQVTFFSILLSALAGLLLAIGLPGFGAIVATSASFFDLIDGMIARKMNIESRFGKLFDSFADRASEFFIFAGILYLFRDNNVIFIPTIIALAGSFWGSYLSSLEREAGLQPGRSFMRRPERMVYLMVGLLLMNYVPDIRFSLLGSPIVIPAFTLTGAIWIISSLSMLAVFLRLKKIYQILELDSPQA